MIRYRLYFLPTLPVVVSLDTQDPDESVNLQYEGQEDAVEMIRAAVEGGWGVGGHRIGARTTPADLATAMESKLFAQYQPELLEGAEVIAYYVREAPKPGSAD